MISSQVYNLPRWKKSEYNRWGDYIELRCLFDPDHIFTIDDLIDLYSDEKADDLKRGSSEHPIKYDEMENLIKSYYNLLEFRSNTLGDIYPFKLKNGKSLALRESITKEHYFYFFLLLSSNLSYIDLSDRHFLTNAFEDISCTVLSCITPQNANTHVFGTSRQEDDAMMFKGSLRTRIGLLAENIFALTTKTFDEDKQFDVPGGDRGIDLISYLPLDNTPFIPISFAQCACSYDGWMDKQLDILPEKWNKRLGNIAPYLQFIFVPFYNRLANGEFENSTDIITCIVDRHRFFSITNNNREPLEKFSQHSIYKKVSNWVSSKACQGVRL